MEAAQEALQAGKVRHIGFSSHSMDMALKMVPTGHFETIQFPFNFVTSEPADKLLPLVEEHDLGFIAMKPFAGGMLADAKLAIKYLLQFDAVVPDPGIETTEEIEEVLDIVNGPWELTAQERQAMENFRAQAGARFCRRCEYCQPCPQGVRISTIMNLPSFLKRFSEEKLLEGWIADAIQTGENCIECGECEEKCPYHLPIREMIIENIALYERQFAVR
jgi:predicted aldo/keto reductase-like oxidoreductase